MVNALYVLALTASLAVLASAAEPAPEAAATAALAPQVNYCNLRTCNGPVHTLCRYPFLQPAKQCGRVISSVLSPYEIQELLDTFNKYYQVTRVAITWEPELAAIAQTWADQCIARVDQCRNTQSLIVAQSYSYTKTTGPFTTRLSELVDLSTVPKGTNLVGCGAIRFNPDGLFNWTHLVCNYATRAY